METTNDMSNGCDANTLDSKITKGRFAGSVAVVTGGAQGIGKAIVERFVNDGAHVAFFDVNNDQGLAVEKELRAKGGEVTFVKCDVADRQQCEDAVAKVVAKYKQINYLVNNAAFGQTGPITGFTTHDVWGTTMSVNVEGVSNMVQACHRYLKMAPSPSIVNLGSSAGLRPDPSPGRWVYCASKAAVISLTKSMAADLSVDGIRVNCVSPGCIWTPAVEEFVRNDPAKWNALLPGWHMLRRCGEPAEVAAVVAFLCSSDASFITSTNVMVDGGLTSLTASTRV